MSDIELIENALADFIAAVKVTEWKSSMAVMNFFPLNCCTVSSFLLGNLLKGRGLGEWHIVNGSSPTGNHDWLESEKGVVVDATPHQFNFGIRPFVSVRPSPMEKYFRPNKVIELSQWTPAHQQAYALLMAKLVG